ncbi:MAG TPA: methyltransferase [Xanthobacteraceae bacterium]|jgi:tRNA1(Val) A37 N6-methylase TrmN6
MPVESVETSEDAVLGGRLVLRQPMRGHRVGHDAILLAAAASAQPGQHAIDLGAGVGAAGLALARRIGGLTVTLIEIDPTLTALAHDNAARNGLARWVNAVCLDVTAPVRAFTAAGLVPGSADQVLMNPPFNVEQKPSPDDGRRLAYAASAATLRNWVKTAARLLRAGGATTVIWRAEGLADVLAALDAGFGAIAILPVHPKPGRRAIRLLARGVKGSRTALSLLPALLLADADGHPTPQAEAVLRHGAALPLNEI